MKQTFCQKVTLFFVFLATDLAEHNSSGDVKQPLYRTSQGISKRSIGKCKTCLDCLLPSKSSTCTGENKFVKKIGLKYSYTRILSFCIVFCIILYYFVSTDDHAAFPEEFVLEEETEISEEDKLYFKTNNEENDKKVSKSNSNKKFNKDDCSKPKVTGPCRARKERFYYDIETEKCVEFIYGGCKGNENNFISLEECNNACSK